MDAGAGVCAGAEAAGVAAGAGAGAGVEVGAEAAGAGVVAGASAAGFSPTSRKTLRFTRCNWDTLRGALYLRGRGPMTQP